MIEIDNFLKQRAKLQNFSHICKKKIVFFLAKHVFSRLAFRV